MQTDRIPTSPRAMSARALDPPPSGAQAAPCSHDAANPLPVSVVVPTLGRASLAALLDSLEASTGPDIVEIIVVDDRPSRISGHPVEASNLQRLSSDDRRTRFTVRLFSSEGRGPAAARNIGWREASQPWIAFLDDDVVVTSTWLSELASDLEGLVPEAGATQGRIVVPLPEGRRPSDWERNVAGLERACWATADMAYRREVLDELGGFDERFARAFREDSDLGLRVSKAGWLILQGERIVHHPVRRTGPGISIRLQAGNADDILMRALHGPDWRASCFAEQGRNGRHAAATLLLTTAALGVLSSKRRLACRAALAWAACFSELTWARIKPGPRTVREVTVMAATSVLLSPAATYYSLKGWASLPRALSKGRSPVLRDSQPALPFPTLRSRVRHGPVPRPVTSDATWEPKAILFDRDGTLIADCHYLKDPEGIIPMPGAHWAVRRVRDAGMAVGVVTNQSGVGRGLMTFEEMTAVNRRVDSLLGPFDYWGVCHHVPEDKCNCRKPASGLVLAAADTLSVRPVDCAVIGDIAADMSAARAAGAKSVLVPTVRTRRSEIRSAYQVAPDILMAVDLVLGGRC